MIQLGQNISLYSMDEILLSAFFGTLRVYRLMHNWPRFMFLSFNLEQYMGFLKFRYGSFSFFK